MKSIVVFSSLVVMLLTGCGEQKSVVGPSGSPSSNLDTISVAAFKADTPSEVTEKFIKALIVDKNIAEASKLSTANLASIIEKVAKAPDVFTDVKVKILNEEINISTKIINGKLNGGKATVEVSMSANLNGQFVDGGHYYYLNQVDGQWLMSRF